MAGSFEGRSRGEWETERFERDRVRFVRGHDDVAVETVRTPETAGGASHRWTITCHVSADGVDYVTELATAEDREEAISITRAALDALERRPERLDSPHAIEQLERVDEREFAWRDWAIQ